MDGGEGSRLGSASQSELRKDVAYVVAGGLDADEEALCDLTVGEPFRDEAQNLDLSLRQQLEVLRARPASHSELSQESRRSIRVGDRAQSVERGERCSRLGDRKRAIRVSQRSTSPRRARHAPKAMPASLKATAEARRAVDASGSPLSASTFPLAKSASPACRLLFVSAATPSMAWTALIAASRFPSAMWASTSTVCSGRAPTIKSS